MTNLIQKIKFNLKEYFLESGYFIDEFAFLVQIYLDNGFLVEISYTGLNDIGSSKELFHPYYINNGYLVFKKRNLPDSMIAHDLSTGKKYDSFEIKEFYDLYKALAPPVNTVYGVILFLSHINNHSIADVLVGQVYTLFRTYCVVASIKTGYSFKQLAALFHKSASQIKVLDVAKKEVNQYLMMINRVNNQQT